MKIQQMIHRGSTPRGQQDLMLPAKMKKNVATLSLLGICLVLTACGQTSNTDSTPQTPTPIPTTTTHQTYEGNWNGSLSGPGESEGNCTANTVITVKLGQFQSVGQTDPKSDCNGGEVPEQTYEIKGVIIDSGEISGEILWGSFQYEFTGKCSATVCSAECGTSNLKLNISRTQ
jgi:hypothetical protein